jgi:hypothetical protein
MASSVAEVGMVEKQDEGSPERKSIVVIKGTQAWAGWYRRLVKHSRMPGPALIDNALKEWAERHGFKEEPPER